MSYGIIMAAQMRAERDAEIKLAAQKEELQHNDDPHDSFIVGMRTCPNCTWQTSVYASRCRWCHKATVPPPTSHAGWVLVGVYMLSVIALLLWLWLR